MRRNPIPPLALFGLMVATSGVHAAVSTANQSDSRGSLSATGSGAIPPSFAPGAGWVLGQRPHGRPSGERYWYTPDFVRIFKIRGDGVANTREGAGGSRREVLPILSWNLKSWNEGRNTGLRDFTKDTLQGHPRRGISRGTSLGVRVQGGWSNVPEFEGWGTQIPYRGLDGGLASRLEADKVLQDLGEKSTAGNLTDKPFDGGITRYEMWLGKKASTTRDQQGNIGGWGQVAWFFDSYNVVNQAGQVLGTLRTETSDSQDPTSRAVRNSPYLVEATEAPLISRTFTASAGGGAVQLRELPKMLTLLSPWADNRGDYLFSGSGSGGAAGGGEGGRTYKNRTYGKDPALAFSVFGVDEKQPLAPNFSIEEGVEEVSKFWGKVPVTTRLGTKNGWAFRRWQRAENLFKAGPNSASNPAWHRWVLETKADALYAPADEGNNSIAIPKAEDLGPLPEMVIGEADVQGFDTGGFVLGMGGGTESGKIYSDPDDISDRDIVTILPIGRFYPKSAIYIALEYRLLASPGRPDGGNDWSKAKTAALFYWNSDGQGGQVIRDADLVKQSINNTDGLTPRRVRFAGDSNSFDPYNDAWIVSLRDISHTSAQYRLRVFMALPFKPINSGQLIPSGTGSVPGANPRSLNRTFDANLMGEVLLANMRTPVTYGSGGNPITEALSLHPATYGRICTEARVKWSQLASVKPVDARVVEGVVSGASTDTRKKAGIALNDAEKWKNPWTTRSSTDFSVQWFEYGNGNGVMSWVVDVPDINVGVDAEAGGVIITE